MGASGPAIFSDDLACDVREDYRCAIGEGKTPTEAVSILCKIYSHSLSDQEEAGVFWFALAATAWKIGRLDSFVKEKALQHILSGNDLERWVDPKLKKKRETVLETLAQQLEAPMRAPVVIRKKKLAENDWNAGELIGFKLKSGKWTLLHVVGHHTDNGGKYLRCELVDWCGAEKPSQKDMRNCKIVQSLVPWYTTNFYFVTPTKKVERARLERWGLRKQKRTFYLKFGKKKKIEVSSGPPFFPWKFVDESILKIYGVG